MVIKGEDIVMEKMANHMRKIFSIGGRLILTKTSLIFKPHGFNIGGKEVVINLTDMDDIGKTLIIGPHANQIWVKSKGQRFRFVVWGRDEFIDAVKNQVASLKG